MVLGGGSPKTAAQVRDDLLARREIALLDVREEAHHAEGHPLFAANLPLSRLELEVFARIPRRSTPIVVFDVGEDLAQRAAGCLRSLGYTDVRLLEDGLAGWRRAGFEIFRDVNAPSKAFGELVAVQRHTPSVSAGDLHERIEAGADMVIVDARRFDEFHTMSIPGATSVPGAELVLRIRELAPKPGTQIVVNCAGRTRSIIGAQSLINAGLPNPVAALRNGTMGWTLAGLPLRHGEIRRSGDVTAERRSTVAMNARRVADQAGVGRTSLPAVAQWREHHDATVYCFDVRSPEEFEQGHLPGFRSAPGGQLVQETDLYAPVRGARIVLVDDDGVRANMTASWLAQMAWAVFVIDGAAASDFSEQGPQRMPLAPLPFVAVDSLIAPAQLAEWLQQEEAIVLDFAPSPRYAKGHIPGAWFALRSALSAIPPARRYVLTSPDGLAARFAFSEVAALTERPVFILEGGTEGWAAAGLAAEDSRARYASPPIDRYRRPYEGTDASPAAMEAYLEWEYGLVEQLHRDGTHGFFVI